jgi:hypothetical protein
VHWLREDGRTTVCGRGADLGLGEVLELDELPTLEGCGDCRRKHDRPPATKSEPAPPATHRLVSRGRTATQGLSENTRRRWRPIGR